MYVLSYHKLCFLCRESELESCFLWLRDKEGFFAHQYLIYKGNMKRKGFLGLYCIYYDRDIGSLNRLILPNMFFLGGWNMSTFDKAI